MIEPELRQMGHIDRWSILRTNHRQTDAAHSYFVAMYSEYIVHNHFPDHFTESETLDVIRAALYHDIPETISGDAPGPYKRLIFKYQPEFKKTASERLMKKVHQWFPWYYEEPRRKIRAVVAVADLFEASMFLSEELNSGNQAVRSTHTYLCDLTKNACSDLGLVMNNDRAAEDLWNDLNDAIQATVNFTHEKATTIDVI